MQIYLDYSATTPTRPEAIAAMQAVLTQQWGNPTSLHEWGQRAAMVVEQARMQVAGLLNADHSEIIFTSGGTEADNLALIGVARAYTQAKTSAPPHLIISSVEHSAVAEPARLLEQWGWDVTRLSVNAQGRVNPWELEAALRPNTALVSVIYGQSEVGTVQPIEALGTVARSHGVLFHTDAVQVAGRLPIDVQQLPVDLLSLSSHKIYGPQGSGALYVRSGVKLAPLLSGGGQELQLRSGTQAVPVIAGFGVAAQLAAQEMADETDRLVQLRDYLFNDLAGVPGLVPTGDQVSRLPHHLSFCVHHTNSEISGKAVVRQMNLAGIGISAGSACHSGKITPSPVLLAMGYPESDAQGAIRLTLGRETTRADVDWVAVVLKQVLERLLPKPSLSRV